MRRCRPPGSGAVISKDGYIITNHHVAGRARHLICRMYDGEEIDAKLVGTDALGDIAIIKLDLSHRKNKSPLGRCQVRRFGQGARGRYCFSNGISHGRVTVRDQGHRGQYLADDA